MALDSFPVSDSRRLGEGRWEHALVIPAYKESVQFLAQYRRSALAQTLVILVINQPVAPSVGDSIACARSPDPVNKALFDEIHTKGQIHWQNHNLSLLTYNDVSILVVDRFSTEAIPVKHGVGLARKIGCDIAAWLVCSGVVNSDQIHTTDADAVLPDDYFLQSRARPAASAYLYGFTHLIDDSVVGRATETYERSIRYYAEGLRWCGSPYDFVALGSCMSLSLEYYCQVRGFPKRSGGEDFYLLNKLAKLAPVVHLGGDAVQIASRVSDRVPFGTGPAVARIVADPDRVYLDYDPQLFVALKRVLERFALLPEAVKEGDLRSWLDALDPDSRSVLDELGVGKLFRHLHKQGFDSSQAIRHIHGWFDGFRTLKFIHALQRRCFQPIPLELALSRLNQLRDASDQD